MSPPHPTHPPQTPTGPTPQAAETPVGVALPALGAGHLASLDGAAPAFWVLLSSSGKLTPALRTQLLFLVVGVMVISLQLFCVLFTQLLCTEVIW